MIDKENLQDNCKNVGTLFLQELLQLRDEYEILGDVRGKGLMLGIELVKSKVEKERERESAHMSSCGFLRE